MRAWEQGGDFRAAIENDPEIRAHLTPEQIAASFSLERQLGNVDSIFERVFGAASDTSTLTLNVTFTTSFRNATKCSAEMEAEARSRNIPIVGPAVGSLLAALVRLSGARRIFELGSAIGYSTIWLARAAGPGAEVHYSDGSEANARQATGYFERAGVADRITIHVGDALASFARHSRSPSTWCLTT